MSNILPRFDSSSRRGSGTPVLEPPDGKPNHFIGAKSMGRNGIRKIRATDVVIHDEYLDALCNQHHCRVDQM